MIDVKEVTGTGTWYYQLQTILENWTEENNKPIPPAETSYILMTENKGANEKVQKLAITPIGQNIGIEQAMALENTLKTALETTSVKNAVQYIYQNMTEQLMLALQWINEQG